MSKYRAPIALWIEGERFASIHDVFLAARSRGYDGTMQSITGRLRRGKLTWQELAAPVSEMSRERGLKGAAATIETRRKAREEMAALIAELDSRKSDLQGTLGNSRE